MFLHIQCTHSFSPFIPRIATIFGRWNDLQYTIKNESPESYFNTISISIVWSRTEKRYINTSCHQFLWTSTTTTTYWTKHAMMGFMVIVLKLGFYVPKTKYSDNKNKEEDSMRRMGVILSQWFLTLYKLNYKQFLIMDVSEYF